MSKTNVTISDMEQVIMDALEDYGEKVKEVIGNALPKVGKETETLLRTTSPKLTGDYAKGWKYQMDTRKRAKGIHKMTVYNKTEYRLTHLLENGHAKVNGGRVEGIAHIAPARDKAEKKAVELIEEGLKKI